MAEDGNLTERHAKDEDRLEEGEAKDDPIDRVDSLGIALLSVLQVFKGVANLSQILVKLANGALKCLSSGISRSLSQHLTRLIRTIDDESRPILICEGNIEVEGLVGGAASMGEADGMLTDFYGFDADFGMGLASNVVELLASGTLNSHVHDTLSIVIGL